MKQVAEAQENMASAGFKVNEILSATPGVLDLAASSGTDLATSSAIAAGALRGFGLDANQAGHVADVLAKAAADTNANVNTMGDAFKYVSPVARGVGLSLEEVSAAIGIMANASIDGSTAGTTLRGAISRLADPSKEASDKMKELSFNAFDSNGKMKSLSTIVDELGKSMKGLTDKQKEQALSIIFGQEAMSGMLTLIQGGKGQLDELTNSFKNSDGAAKQMATTMQDNAQNSIEQMMGSLETARIKIEKALAPSIKKISDVVGNLADKFSQLDPETQQSIIKFGLLAASVGPCILVFGRLMESVVTIQKGFQLLKGLFFVEKIVQTGAAATTAAGGIGAMGTAARLTTLALNPWVLGMAAAGFGLYKLVKYLNDDSVPAVDYFGEHTKKAANDMGYMSAKVGTVSKNISSDMVKISDSTKKAITAYMDLDKKAGTALLSLKANNIVVTKQIADDMSKNINDMGKQITDGLKKRSEEGTKTFQDFFKNAKNITDNEKANILKSVQNGYDQQTKSTEAAKNKINEIYLTAANNHRQITDDEVKQIQALQEQMRQQAVTILSQSQLEQQAIYEGIKNSATAITTQQASEVIKNSANQRDQTIAAATEQAQKIEAEIIYQRDVAHTITADQATKLIAEAERQKKDIITKAEEQHKAVVDEVGKQCKDVADKIDQESGSIKTPWQRLCDWFTQNVLKPQIDTSEIDYATAKVGGLSGSSGGATEHRIGGHAYATGTTNAARGWNLVGEEGPELLWFEGGETVLNNRDTTALMEKLSSKISYASAKTWGNDFMQGLADGINDNKNNVYDSSIKVADSIYRVLHFSVPDDGPLADADSYGSDFMELLADTIEQNSDKPADAAKKVADLVSEKIKSIKDILSKDTKELNNQLYNLGKEEEVTLRGVKGSRRYSIQDEYDVKKKVIKDEIALRKDQADKEIAEIQRIGKMSKEQLQQEITDRKDFVDSVNNLESKLVDALKQKYQEEEKAQEDSLNAELDNLDKWKDESEKRINDVYDTKIKAIEDSTNAQIAALQAESDALDEQSKQDDRAGQDQVELANIQKLKDKIVYEHNDFNKAELQKQLEQAIADRTKRLNQQAIDDKKESLKKQMDDIKANADEQKQMLEDEKSYELNRMNQLYNAQKDNLQKRLANVKAFYAERIKDAKLQAEAEKLIMDNNQKDIVALLHKYEPDYQAAGQSLGEKLVEGFAPQVQKIKDMINSLTEQINSLNAQAASAISSVKAAAGSVSSKGSSTTTNNSKTVINNNISYTSPTALTPSQMTRATQTALTTIGFAFGLR